jgi:hypothetical protein
MTSPPREATVVDLRSRSGMSQSDDPVLARTKR